MRYKLRQNIFALKTRFYITNIEDIKEYEVEGKFFSLGDKLTIYNRSGEEVIYIKQILLKLFAEYEIYQYGEYVGKVKQKFSFLKPKAEIESIYGDYSVDGNIIAHEFNILKDRQIVGEVSKKFLSLSDFYTVDIAPNENKEFLLALVIVLDAIYHSNNAAASSASSSN